MEQGYSVRQARYAKGMMAIQPLDSANGFKGLASGLCDRLNGRWTHRDGAYLMSPRKVARFERAYARLNRMAMARRARAQAEIAENRRRMEMSHYPMWRACETWLAHYDACVRTPDLGDEPGIADMREAVRIASGEQR